jgi:hypothetical protein
MKLPLKESLMVVSCFLEEVFYNQTKSDQLGDLLSGMAIDASDNTTMDLAVMGDWEDAIEKVLHQKEVTEISSTEGFHAMIEFLKIYENFTAGFPAAKEWAALIKELEPDPKGTSFHPDIAKDWDERWQLGIDYMIENKNVKLNKHFQRIPSSEKEVMAYAMPDGHKIFQATIQGKLPFSHVVYEKEIDELGKTVGYKKTTTDNNSAVIQIKDKLNPAGG